MPHAREVSATSHDRHDPILVAALAADDLAGTDRDQALDLTRSCADCALLHDDLIALARATATVPPPIAARPRDFQLTPADAARLRPGGWRRLVAAISGARSGVTRPLGVGLATLGLAGLLIGNVQIGFGSAGAMPAASSADQSAAGGASSTREMIVQGEAASPASAGPPYDTAAGAPIPAASAAPRAAAGQGDFGAVVPAGAPSGEGAALVPGSTAKSAPTEQSTTDLAPLNSTATTEHFRPLNLLFGAAIVLGLGLLIASYRRGRPTI